MTDTVPERAASWARRFEVRRLRDRRAIDARLSEDRAYATYALGYLEPDLFERSRFWEAAGEDGWGMVLVTDALGPAVVTVGEASAIEAILSIHPGPRRAYLSTAAPEHVPAIERWHRVEEPLFMHRMSVTRASFRPQHEDAPRLRRLRGLDARAVNALYALDERPSHYSASQIEGAVYYGRFDGDRLVSVAGTHVVSPLAGTGMVGNVLTHPAHRGRGHATLVTSAVTAELFRLGCSTAVLTADQANTPAVRAYERLGYRRGAPVVEAHLARRDPLGIGSWLRRRRASRTGGDVEVVRRRPLGR